MVFTMLVLGLLSLFGAFAWRSFTHALVLLCALTPTYLVRFSVGPMPTTLFECLLLITFVIYALRFLRHDLPRLTKATKEGRGRFWIVLLFIAAIVSTIIAPDRLSALGILKAFYIEPFLFAAILSQRFQREDYKMAFFAFCASGLIVSAFAIVQILFSVGIPEAWRLEGRATSFFPYPNAVGLFLAPIVTACVLLIAHLTPACTPHPGPLLGRRGGYIGAVMLMLVAIVLAKTEAALIAIPAAIFVVLMITPIKRQMKALIASGSIITGLLAIAFVPAIAQKLSLQDTSGLVRRSQWSETFSMLADHSYLGVGLNAYPTALEPYHDATLYEIFQYPHNIVLNIWSELGLIGLIAFVGLFGVAARVAWENKKDPWVLACFGALLTMVIHGLVDVPFFKNDLAILTVFFFVAMMNRENAVAQTHKHT